MTSKLAWSLAVFTTIAALGDTPPGYELIRITNSDAMDYTPRINARGDVVFTTRFDNNKGPEEIMLYSAGALVQITDDDVRDVSPTINDDGVIVWSRHNGHQDEYGDHWGRIVRWTDGVMEYLTGEDANSGGPIINNAGHIAWTRLTYDDRGNQTGYIPCLYDGEKVIELTDGSTLDQVGDINDSDVIVWSRTTEDTDQIILRDGNGEEHIVSDDQVTPQGPRISNNGNVTWMYEREGHRVAVLQDGVLTELAEGSTPDINNHGDLAFGVGGGESRHDQVWAYLRGEFYHISDESVWNGQGRINDRTDIVWMTRGYPVYDIVMLKRRALGDVNCDGRVDMDDVDGFVLALIGKDEFNQAYPGCDWWLADLNDDRSVDFGDIDPFVDCLVNGGCER